MRALPFSKLQAFLTQFLHYCIVPKNHADQFFVFMQHQESVNTFVLRKWPAKVIWKYRPSKIKAVIHFYIIIGHNNRIWRPGQGPSTAGQGMKTAVWKAVVNRVNLLTAFQGLAVISVMSWNKSQQSLTYRNLSHYKFIVLKRKVNFFFLLQLSAYRKHTHSSRFLKSRGPSSRGMPFHNNCWSRNIDPIWIFTVCMVAPV